jgi:type IV pilus modification protein PilV
MEMMNMDSDMRHIDNKQSGFTLLELLVAITILLIGLTAVASMQAIALRSNSVSNKVSVASFIAQQVAEEISSRNSSDPILNHTSTGTYQFTDWSTGAQQIVSGLSITSAGTYTATYTIQANTYNGTAFTGMTEIQVTVNANNVPITYTAHKMVL